MLIASCHCNAIRLEVEAAPSYINECHCSVCRRYGALWGYYRRDQVRLLGAPGATDMYCWGERNLEFHRCRSCGCVTHWVDTDTTQARMAINTRLLEPAEIADVPVRRSPGPA